MHRQASDLCLQALFLRHVQRVHAYTIVLVLCWCWMTIWVHLLAQIDLVQGMMDCLYAECTPCITDCVMAELEKLGQKYRVALKVAKVRHSLSPWTQCT